MMLACTSKTTEKHFFIFIFGLCAWLLPITLHSSVLSASIFNCWSIVLLAAHRHLKKVKEKKKKNTQKILWCIPLRLEQPPLAPSVDNICRQRSWEWRYGASCVGTQMVLRRPEDSDWQLRKWKWKMGGLFVGTGVFHVLSCCVGASNLCILLARGLRSCVTLFRRDGRTLPRSSVHGKAAIECKDQLKALLIKLNVSAKLLQKNK